MAFGRSSPLFRKCPPKAVPNERKIVMHVFFKKTNPLTMVFDPQKSAISSIIAPSSGGLPQRVQIGGI